MDYMSDIDEPQKPSEGVLARLAEKFGIKSESTILSDLKAENAALLATANEVQAELEKANTALANASANVTALSGKIRAMDAIVPGISSSANPSELMQQHIATASANQIASMGMDPGTAPPVAPKQDGDSNKLTHSEFVKLPVSKQNEYMATVGKLKS